MTKHRIDRSKVTFSQAEGFDPLPRPAALGELSRSARNLLWEIVYRSLQESIFPRRSRRGDIYILEDPWRKILYHYHLYLIKPGDEFVAEFSVHSSEIKNLLLHGEYNRVFDFLQFVLRQGIPSDINFRYNIAYVLKEYTAYTIIDDGPSIIPIALPEQRKSIEEAFQSLALGPFEAARNHLRKSAEHINKGDFAGSIRESIHAVESVARRLNADAAISLTPALDALSSKISIHPAFKKGIENFYGYASDKDGIRHAEIKKDQDVDMEDAVFMFGACASFAAFLVNKARKAGLLNST